MEFSQEREADFILICVTKYCKSCEWKFGSLLFPDRRVRHETSATHLAAKYVDESWADVARHTIIRTPRTQCTVAEAPTTRIEAQQCAAMHTPRISHNHTVYKSKRATDLDVDKNNSHGEHFLKKKRMFIMGNIHQYIYLGSLYRHLSVKNFNKWIYKLSRTVHAYYSRPQPIFTRTKFYHV